MERAGKSVVGLLSEGVSVMITMQFAHDVRTCGHEVAAQRGERSPWSTRAFERMTGVA